ncbi:hypothetical protein DY000_02062649 [Brassica cretica]|uniref:ABC-2 type transporter transmembrane domain-containing protein n=1 Tax=Brassica cretica TaxID=69181 RepID=A0ABQ7B459_BRACR|nr:hypothetical protein DY000_02062649 [Brassica cretica]
MDATPSRENVRFVKTETNARGIVSGFTTWFSQLCILLHRLIKERRHESFDALRVFQVVAASLLAGLMWWHSDFRDVHDRLGLLFFVSIFWGVLPSFNAVFTFPQERAFSCYILSHMIFFLGCCREQPGVIRVVPSKTYQLHKPVGGGFKLT